MSDYCLFWPKVNDQGYGITVRGIVVHRIIWELSRRRKIPEGMVVHHICQRKNCFQPKHLRLLTPGLHMKHHAKLRGFTINTHEYEPWPYGAPPRRRISSRFN